MGFFDELDKWKRGVIAQVNPFDDGQTFDTVRRGVEPGSGRAGQGFVKDLQRPGSRTTRNRATSSSVSQDFNMGDAEEAQRQAIADRINRENDAREKKLKIEIESRDPWSSFTSGIRNRFDSNTPEDRINRLREGRQEVVDNTIGDGVANVTREIREEAQKVLSGSVQKRDLIEQKQNEEAEARKEAIFQEQKTRRNLQIFEDDIMAQYRQDSLANPGNRVDNTYAMNRLRDFTDPGGKADIDVAETVRFLQQDSQQNPQNEAKNKQDINALLTQTLAKGEAVKPHGTVEQLLAAGLNISRMNPISGLQSFNNYLDTATEGVPGLEQFANVLQKPSEKLVRTANTSTGRPADADFAQIEGSFADPSNIDNPFIEQGAEFMGMLGQTANFGANPAIGAIATAGIIGEVGQENYDELRAQGKSHFEALARATPSAAIQAAIERYSARFQVALGVNAQAGAGIAKMIAAEVGTEASEEVLQVITDNLATGKPWYENVPQSALGGAKGGLLLGGTFAGVNRYGGGGANTVQQQQQEAFSDMRNDISGMVGQFSQSGFNQDESGGRSIDQITGAEEVTVDSQGNIIEETAQQTADPQGLEQFSLQQAADKSRLILGEDIQGEGIEEFSSTQAGSRASEANTLDKIDRVADSLGTPAGPAINTRAINKNMIGKKTAPKVEIKTDQLLRNYLRREARGSKTGYKEGSRETRERLREAFKVKKNVDKLRATIKKELAQTKPKRVSGKLTSDLTPEIQVELDSIKAAIKLPRAGVQARIEELENKPQLTPKEARELDLKRMTDINQLSPTQLMDTLDNIRSLVETGKTLNEIDKNNIKEHRQGIIDAAIQSVNKKDAPQSVGGTVDVKKEPLKFFTNMQMGWADVMNKLFAGEGKSYTSELEQWGNDAIIASESTEIASRRRTIVDVQQAYANIHGKNFSTAAKEGSEKHLIGEFKDDNGDMVELNLSQNEAYPIWQKLQDPSLENKFDAMGWTDEMKQAVEQYLTPETRAWAEWQLENFYPGFYERINEVYRADKGIDLPFNKFYTPIKTDIADSSADLLQGEVRQYSESPQSLKSRTGSNQPFEFADGNDVLFNHIFDMEHYMAFNYSLNEIKAVFADPQLRRTIQRDYGNDTLKTIKFFTDKMASKGASQAEAVKEWDAVRANFTTAVLGMNPSVFIKQLASLPGTMTELSVKDFTEGVANFVTNPHAKAKFLIENSVELQNRYEGGMTRDMTDALNMNQKGLLTGKMGFREAVMLPVRMGDRFGALPGAWAVYKTNYEQAIANGMEEDAAVAHGIAKMEQTTLRTQQSSRSSSLSRMQSTGTFGKFMTMFQNQTNQYYRIALRSARDIKEGRNQTQAVKSLAITWFVLPTIFQFISSGFKWEDERQLRAAILGPLNGILAAGNAIETLVRIVADDDVFGTGLEPGPYDIVQDAANWLKDMKDLAWSDIDLTDITKTIEDLELEDVASMAGRATGIPAENVIDMGKDAYNLATGHEENRSPLNILREVAFSDYALSNPKEGEVADVPSSEATTIEEFKKATDKENKELRESYLNEEERKIDSYSEEQAEQAIRQGLITQEQVDAVKDKNAVVEIARGNKKLEFPEGMSEEAMKTLNKENRLSDKGKENYREGKPDQYAKDAAADVNKSLPEGIDDFKANNRLGLAHAELDKALAEAPDPIEKEAAQKTFWKEAVYSQFPESMEEIYEHSANKVEDYVAGLSKESMDRFVTMDNYMVLTGAYKSGKLDNKWRAKYGYGAYPGSKGGSGRGGGSKASPKHKSVFSNKLAIDAVGGLKAGISDFKLDRKI